MPGPRKGSSSLAVFEYFTEAYANSNSVSIPGSVTAGMLAIAIAVVAGADNADTSVPYTITANGNFTTIDSAGRGSGGAADNGYTAAYRKLTASDISTGTVSFNAGIGASPSQNIQVYFYTMENCDVAGTGNAGYSGTAADYVANFTGASYTAGLACFIINLCSQFVPTTTTTLTYAGWAGAFDHSVTKTGSTTNVPFEIEEKVYAPGDTLPNALVTTTYSGGSFFLEHSEAFYVEIS